MTPGIPPPPRPGRPLFRGPGIALVLASILASTATLATQEPLAISGEVRDSELRPLSGVHVELYATPSSLERSLLRLDAEHPESSGATTTDAEGFFRLALPVAGPDGAPGHWTVRFRREGLLTGEYHVDHLLQGREVSVTLQPARRLHVRAVDAEDGSALAGVRVIARSRGSFARGYRLGLTPLTHPLEIGLTNGDGIVELEAATGAPVQVTAVRNDTLIVYDRTDGDELTLALPRRPTARIRVLEPDGTPSAGAVVDSSNTLLTKTDDQGVAELARLEGPRLVRIKTASATSALVEIPGVLAAEAGGEPLSEPLEVRTEPDRRLRLTISTPDGETPPATVAAWAGRLRAPSAGAIGISVARADLALLDRLGPEQAPALGSVAVVAPFFEEETLAVIPSMLEHQPLRVVLEPATLLTGRVGDRRGGPVEDAVLHLRSDSRGRAWSSTRDRTPSGGSFALRAEAGTAYTLEVSSRHHAPWRTEIAPLDAGEQRVLEIVLDGGVTASGWVLDESGAPIAAASVELSRAAGGGDLAAVWSGSADHETPWRATTDASGRFAFEHLPADRFDLLAEAAGFAPATVRGVEVTADPVVQELGTVTLSPEAFLAGRVVDSSGAPLAGAIVEVAGRDGSLGAFGRVHEAKPRTSTDREGRFRIGALASGDRYRLVARLAGFAPGTLSGARASVDPDSEPLEIELEPGARVAGRVVDADGDGVPARVVLFLQPAGLQLEPRYETTEQEGVFDVADLRAGSWLVRAAANGYLPSDVVDLELSASTEVTDLELRLDTGAVLAGTVYDGDGSPLEGVDLRQMVQHPGGPGALPFAPTMQFARTDASGRYRLGGLPTGTATLHLSHAEHPETRRSLELQPGENQRDFRLDRGVELSGAVRGPDGEPLPGVRVELRHDAGGAVRIRSGLPPGETLSDGSGRFSIVGVADGRYRLAASKEGWSTATVGPLEIAGAPLDGLEIELSRGAAVRGRVVGLDSDELSRVSILASRMSDASGPRMGVPDFDGAYRLDGLAEGTWLLMAMLDGGSRTVQETVRVDAGVSEMERDLDFGGGLVLTGIVLDAGLPVADAIVAASTSSLGSSGWSSTDAEGRFRIENLAEGRHQLMVRRQTGGTAGATHSETLELTADRDIVVELPSGRLEGRVVDETGEPLRGAQVALEPRGGTSVLHQMSAATATTGADGAFRFSDVAPGRYALRGSLAGFASGRLEVELWDDPPPELLLRLERDVHLELVVLAPDGRPAETIVATALDGGGAVVAQTTALAGADGRVVLDAVPRGTWDFWISDSRAPAQHARLDVPGGPVTIQLRAGGGVRLRVVPLENGPAVALARFRDAAGREYHGGAGGMIGANVPVVGGVLESRLPAGAWSVSIETVDQRSWSASFAVVEGQNTEVLIE